MNRRTALAISLSALLAACAPKGPSKETLAANKKAADDFMAKTRKEEGVVALPSGLAYKVVQAGPEGGEHPKVSDEIKIHYEGKLASDGKVFDSSYDRGVPQVFPLEGLIPAWKEALPLMRPGDTWLLYTPPELGYGEKGAGNDIPPNSALIFKIELIGVLSHPMIGNG